MKRALLLAALACSCIGKVNADAIGSPETDQLTCSTNQRCIDANGGQPYICRRPDRVCVPLTTLDCSVLAEPGDPENDATVWLGVVYPQATPDGEDRRAAVDLARSELVAVTSGLPPEAPGKPRRPLAFVFCDEAAEPRGTKHLVGEVRVAAILGYETEKDFAAAAALAVPNGVLLMSAGSADPGLSQLDPGSPRLLWSATPPDVDVVTAMAKAVGAVMEPQAHARIGAGSGPIKVALLRPNDAYATSLAARALPNITFNGTSFAGNGANGIEVTYVATEAQSVAAVAQSVLTFAPDVVVAFGGSEIATIVAAVETGWTKSLRPLYLGVGWNTDTWSSAVAANAALRGRTFVVDVDPRTNVEATGAFQARFVSKYPDLPPPGFRIGTSYDAVYVLAGAVVAGGPTLTGASLGGAIPKLTTGATYPVGPEQLPGMFSALANGTVDLDGVSGPLDFHPDTGEVDVDVAVECVVDKGASPSGVLYRWASGVFEGQVRCP
jgi:branched-chain amino acid transport system substrate-binding protein